MPIPNFRLRVSKPSINMIRGYEKQLGLTLPEDYRDYLAEYNGGVAPSPELSISWGQDRGTTIKQLYSLGSDPNGMSMFELSRQSDPNSPELPPGVIAIGMDTGGNKFCLGLHGETRNKVYWWNHETGDLVSLAESFTAFLKALTIFNKPPEDEIAALGKSGTYRDLVTFIERGNSIESKNQYGRTPLQEAACHGNLELLIACQQHGGKLDGAIHLAALNCELPIVEYLLTQGVDVNSRDEHGRTPLSYGKRRPPMAEYLRSKGARE